MTSRNSIHILIFSFAVLMVLLRPYAAYRMSMSCDLAGDPVKVNNLLQRLIKKKEEHHAVADENLEAVIPAKAAKSLPAVLLLFLLQAFAPVSATLKRLKEIVKVFRFCHQHKSYLSLLCIRL
jgi:hypothetical protein